MVAITWKHRNTDFSWPLCVEDKIDIFYERIYGWQLHIADICSNGEKDDTGNIKLSSVPHSGFAVLQILLSYFETIAKYQEGYAKEGQSKKYFKKGVHSVFPDLASESPKLVNQFLDHLYANARCGLYHSSMTLAGVALGKVSESSMGFSEEHKQLVINPHLLPQTLKNHFATYCNELRDPSNAGLQEKFEKRFDFDNKQYLEHLQKRAVSS